MAKYHINEKVDRFDYSLLAELLRVVDMAGAVILGGLIATIIERSF